LRRFLLASVFSMLYLAVLAVLYTQIGAAQHDPGENHR